jgi:hypothetical protein
MPISMTSSKIGTRESAKAKAMNRIDWQPDANKEQKRFAPNFCTKISLLNQRRPLVSYVLINARKLFSHFFLAK